MKAIVYLVFFQLTFSVSGQERMLRWTDSLHKNYSWELYKPKPMKNGFAALTVVKRHYHIQFKDDVLSVDYYVELDTKESCYDRIQFKKQLPTKELLAHEKMHFDIYEYYKRLFYKEIASLKETNPEVLYKKIDKIRARLEKECDVYQNKYDRTTKHSVLRDQQKDWEREFYANFNKTSQWNLSNYSYKF